MGRQDVKMQALLVTRLCWGAVGLRGGSSALGWRWRCAPAVTSTAMFATLLVVNSGGLCYGDWCVNFAFAVLSVCVCVCVHVCVAVPCDLPHLELFPMCDDLPREELKLKL